MWTRAGHRIHYRPVIIDNLGISWKQLWNWFLSIVMETIIDCKKIRLSSGNVNSFHYLQCWGQVIQLLDHCLPLSATVIILPLLSFQFIQMNLFPQYKTPFYCFNFLYSWILLETSVWCSVIKQRRERENVAHIHLIFPKGPHFRIIQNAVESIYQ